MTAISKTKMDKRKANRKDNIIKISKTSFKRKDKSELQTNKNIKKIVSKNKNENKISEKEINKNESSKNSYLKNNIGLSLTNMKEKKESSNILKRSKAPSKPKGKTTSPKVLKENKVASKEINKKKIFQSQKDYMKMLKEKEPEFFKAIIDSKDVLEGTGCSDEEFDDDAIEEDTFSVDDLEEEEDSCDDAGEDSCDDEGEDSCDEEEEVSCDDEEEDSCNDENDSCDEEEENSCGDADDDDDESSDGINDSKFSLRKEEDEDTIFTSDEEVDDLLEKNMESESCDEMEEEDAGDLEMDTKNVSKSGKITKNMIKEWKVALKNTKTAMSTFKCAEHALAAAIISILGSDDDKLHSPYTVEGPQMFNLIVKFCLSDVAPALHKLFDLKTLSDRPAKNSKWRKLALTNSALKNYLKHLILLTKSITEATGIEVLLKKGILPLLPIYVELPDVGWNLMKHMISLWCTSYEKVRVLSLIAIFRLLRSFKVELREKCMKALYMSYVKNCHFTSPVSWPMIDFMRMSLVELYCLDQPLAYRHAFVYIRQLALHLRNALLVQKKERVQLVYNWQFIHCIRLWAELLGKTHPSKILQPIIYPLVQVAIGTIGLMKTPKYFPLIFHVCSILIELSNSTDTFIPVMPPLLQILSNHRIQNKPKKTSMKTLQWDSIIKVSSAQMNESAFTDGLIDQVYNCLLYYLNIESASIGFPELVFIASLKIKSFLRKCKIPSYNKKIKQLSDIMKENATFIENRRKDVQFGISDAKAIKDWEIATLQSSPPIHTFYLQWKNLKDKNLKTEQSFSSNSEADETLVKEKLAFGAQKKIGHHLLVKRDEEDLERSILEEEEIVDRSNKRKEDSSSANALKQSKKKKTSEANSDEVVEDLVKEVIFSDNDEETEDDDLED